MNSVEKVIAPGAADSLAPPPAHSWWDRFERTLARLSDLLNPILVKEARQALRSKQFVITFLLMLVAGWAWSMLGLAALGPGVYYSADGPTMFYGYYLILTFPLLIVTPYAAFQSLSSERQDRTYELVSITSLSPRQILSGKLGSIVLQMIVYLSAIFPCLSFTYLLRGLDIFTILFTVFYTSCMSLGAAVFGLLLATLPAPRQRQIGSNVAFAVLLITTFLFNLFTVFGQVSSGIALDSPGFWLFNTAWVTIYLNAFALTFLAARAGLMTVSQNHSTALRVALVVAQMSLAGWCGYAELSGAGDVVYGFLYFSTLMWWLAGIFLTGEPARLSPRVKRDLPQSILGRAFGTWLAPGPGTGYVFAVANMIGAAMMFNLPYQGFQAALGIGTLGAPVAIRPGLFEACVIAISYLTIYLGIGKLVLSLIGKYTQATLAPRVLVHGFLLICGSGIPWAIQMSLPSLRVAGYTLLQITNPLWTIYDACFRGIPATSPALIYPLATAALAVFGLNMLGLVEELRQVRVAKPPRVAEDDAAMATASAPAALRTSPWDDAASRA